MNNIYRPCLLNHIEISHFKILNEEIREEIIRIFKKHKDAFKYFDTHEKERNSILVCSYIEPEVLVLHEIVNKKCHREELNISSLGVKMIHMLVELV